MNENADNDSRMIRRQQAAERVQKAYREGRAKETRKYKAGMAKRANLIAVVNTWMVRLFGGGAGGV